jgi:hypothetical protein
MLALTAGSFGRSLTSLSLYGLPAPIAKATSAPTYTVSQLLPLTVSEAWDLSGHNYDNITAMAKTLAELSAEKRGLAITDSSLAGIEIG